MVDKLQAHLENLRQYVLLAAPAAQCEQHLLGL